MGGGADAGTTASTVDGVLRRTAARVPDRVALRFGDREWRYAELDAAVSRTAAWLLGLGLERGDRVAAYGRNSDAYLLAFLGCARAGLVHVPVDHRLTGAELAYLLARSGSTVVLADPRLAGRVEEIRSRIPAREVLALRGAPESVLEVARDPRAPAGAAPGAADTDLVQLLYTSGTTSRPKGAMMSHRALVHEYASCVHALDITAGDRMLHALPLHHSAQMHVFLLPGLAVGAENEIVEAPEPGGLLRRIEGGATSFFAAPTVWLGMADHPDFATRDLSGLRKAYYGAAIMPVPVLRRIRRRCPRAGFYNCFGQSEIGPLATVLRPEEHVPGRMDSCGRPVLFVEARLVDQDGADVAPGEPGEVVYRSPQLCDGYWDEPEETAAAFRGGWFHSGDLARRDAEGYLTIVDRLKDVINTGGVLVASREVEDVLYLHPAVAEAAVVAMPHPTWGEAVTAVVALKGPATEAELIAFARERLAGFKAPKRVHVVEQLPRNASGKLLKRVLREELTAFR
ncbi:fatty acyl-CoA synthetase [Marinitenerispora sediminis]|uniref:Acyl-CoA synthetase n=1 Tax=Marinitenerispora sediminis TaxID=1931232 RepID=A0A368TAG4_9ACTN|nr:fatty acyl-CoA synthetase [Marinitenerispora sediminis]RCV52870.1 acyl-CoA synthetase [Marinitenerispora sediminis]RCV60046.1 acyl-CoA synthetase [Marinitenerispora sediminis]RCV61953.1 acyl-CoA synthetase [Marinitenerispora sediminis]